MADIVSVLYQFGTNAAFLLLCALGLIVILGMMNIINLAHGEFMMLGAYAATAAVHRGLPLPSAFSACCWSV
jgi:branched-chain amino acid transport system permease protein